MTTIWRTMLRLLATRGRLAVCFVLALLAVGLIYGVGRAGLDANSSADQISRAIVGGLGFGLLVPVVSLAFASSALAEPIEDGTLVYLWLRPVPRWQLALGVAGATATLALPFVVIPLGIGVWLKGASLELIGLTSAAAALASLAYSSVLVFVGGVVRRALSWGLAYVFIWEGFAAIYEGARPFSIGHHAASILKGGESVAQGVTILICIALAGIAFTTLVLARRDIP